MIRPKPRFPDPHRPSPAPAAHGLLLQALRRHMRKIDSHGGPGAGKIHDVRTGVKRLRASWRLLRPVLPKALFEKENRALLDSAHGLTALREAHVLAKTLKKTMEREGDGVGKVLARMRDREPLPTAGNAAQASRSAEKALAGAQRALAGSLVRFERLDPDLAGCKPLPDLLMRSYRKAKAAFQDLPDAGDEGYHDWRKRVKDHGYQLEALKPILGSKAGETIRSLDRLQGWLGDEHDLTMLMDHLETHPDLAGGPGGLRRLAGHLNRERGRKRRKCMSLGKRLFARKPRSYAAFITMVRASHTRPASAARAAHTR